MRLVKLEEVEEIKPFDCGDTDLNGFLFEDAWSVALCPEGCRTFGFGNCLADQPLRPGDGADLLLWPVPDDQRDSGTAVSLEKPVNCKILK